MKALTDKQKRLLKLTLKVTFPIWILPWLALGFVWAIFLEPVFEEVDDFVDGL